MAGFKSAGTFVQVFFMLLIFSLLIHIAGIFTVYWMKYSFYLIGLWRICDILETERRCGWIIGADWFLATQILESLGFVAGFVGLILITIHIFKTRFSNNKIVYIIAMTLVFLAACFTIVGVIIFGTNGSFLSVSFELAVIGGVAYGLAGSLMLVNMLIIEKRN